MVLPKYFLLTARKILILPKSSKLGGVIAPLPPRQVRLWFLILGKSRKLGGLITVNDKRGPVLRRKYTFFGTESVKEKLNAFIFHTTWRKDKNHVIPDALLRAPCRDPEPEDITNVDTTRMIRKNVYAILRGKDPEVTKETFIDPMV